MIYIYHILLLYNSMSRNRQFSVRAKVPKSVLCRLCPFWTYFVIPAFARPFRFHCRRCGKSAKIQGNFYELSSSSPRISRLKFSGIPSFYRVVNSLKFPRNFGSSKMRNSGEI